MFQQLLGDSDEPFNIADGLHAPASDMLIPFTGVK